jgi:SAM-dependent methyltransferase
MDEDRKFLYVDDQLRFLTGTEAAEALRERSDARFLDAGKGVVRVPRERWEEAQRYERDTWLVAAAEASDDRNEEHREGFGNYEALHGRSFQHAAELGCGPFTNLRLIARYCSIASCTLVDPLIPQYLHHRHCRYDRRHLRLAETSFGRTLGGSRIGRVAARVLRKVAPGLLSRQVPVRDLLATPIEEMNIDRPQFDLVVMINVIEHCFDAEKIFSVISRILEPGGVFVFHDKLFDGGEIAADVETRFDAGHPLRVQREVVMAFLERDFRPLYSRTERVADGFDDIDLTRDAIYFIGERKR